jgi:two-component system response regulator YesN
MLKVMLIDDEAPFRTGLRELINWKQHGYEIIAEAGSGRSALELIDIKKPDIIIVDMNMPVMNGAELIEQVAAVGQDKSDCLSGMMTMII